MTDRRIEFETSDNRTLCDIIKEKWLKYEDFNNIRTCTEFNKIEVML